MNHIFWYGGKRWCKGIYTPDVEAAADVARGIKRLGGNIKVVWLVHTQSGTEPYRGYEAAYEQWKNDDQR